MSDSLDYIGDMTPTPTASATGDPTRTAPGKGHYLRDGFRRVRTIPAIAVPTKTIGAPTVHA